MESLPTGFLNNKLPAQRGIAGALIDLEQQRIELIKFNLFDNNQTYEGFIKGRAGRPGPTLTQWDALRLLPTNVNYKAVGGDGKQVCSGELIRWRALTGICNDVFNPAMGSTGTLFIRDREHGVPRFNEFRRQYGLRQLTSFDDFLDQHEPQDSAARRKQEEAVRTLREVYGQHVCDASKQITDAQRNADGTLINDCLGHPNGSLIDNIEDVDTEVGWLAEYTRPHGFAISETQFVVFILNASRRLFSDRFLTSSFRPEFYTTMGVDWVNNNGPGPAQMEKGMPNGHKQQVSPFKRVLLRNIPELRPELEDVVNVFDPWGRDRGSYYTLDWKAAPGAAAVFSSPKK